MLFTVTKNKVELVEQEPVNHGEYKATVLTFDFVSAYNGLTKKAIIKSNVSDKSYEVPVIDGECDIPAEILAQKGTATVGVYGYEVEGDNLVLRYSPSPASFKVIDGSYTEDVENPSDVTPSQAAIYEAQIQKKIDEVDAVVEDVEEKRDSGAFDGKDGKDGKDGADGKDGKDGAAATINVGTTTTLEAGSDATVENTGTTSDAVFNFGIPKGVDGKDGKDGTDGQAATIAVGTVSTLTPGSDATVQNAGTSSAAIFNFGIPQGAKGNPGQNGQDGTAATIAVGTVSTLTPGSNATVTNSGTSSAAVFNFGIPQGAKGDPGSYSDFIGTDGSSDGTHGLVPAPTVADVGKFLKSDGTWETAGGGGPTVVQTTGTSTTDVMSQNATTSMVFADPSTKYRVNIGGSTASDFSVAVGSQAYAAGSQSVAIGLQSNTYSGLDAIAIGVAARARKDSAISIGYNAGHGYSTDTQYKGAISLGACSEAHAIGEMNIGSYDTAYGYNNSNYRLLTGLYDGQSAHDAATVAQGNKLMTAAPTTTDAGVLGQLWTDTTNMHTYQCTAISGDTYTWTQRW